MPSAAHAVMTEIVFRILPSWEQDFWAEHRANIARYASLPDEIMDCNHAA